MHTSVYNWVQNKVVQYDLSYRNTLEVGSYDVNGSVRPLFDGEYVGVDMRKGPGVDIVSSGHALPFPDEYFDVVISTEMLEHDPAFWLSMKEMGRVLKKNGYLIITARGNGFPLHDYPGDYWRFMVQSFFELLKLAGTKAIGVSEDDGPGHPGVFAIGRK